MKNMVNEIVVGQFIRSLEALKENMLKATEYAKERKFDENLFLQTRLIADMLPFVKQVQIATDNAKGAAARLSGKTAPVFADDEKTMTELLARIDKTITFLSEFKNYDFSGFETKEITFPWYPNKVMNGYDYFTTHAIPNFFFHVTTAYALLRSNGVQIGKANYLGNQPWKTI